jgi:ADP-ribose pyrophosphatase YjhB (NUDIX family)
MLGASVGVYRPDGSVLIAERLSDPGRGLFSFPGGRVELGETVAEAALRELREEVDLGAELVGLIDTVDAIHRDTEGHVVFHALVCVFAARWTGGEPSSSPEAGRLVWTPAGQVGRYPTTRRLPEVALRGAAMLGLPA